MDLKEKILKDVAAKSEYVTYDDIVENVKEEIHEAMEELSKIVAIAFGKFISTHRLDFQPASPDGYWIGLDMKKYSTEDLFQLFTQSKEYHELIDGK